MHTMEVYEKPFILEIQDANHNITFCGVGSNHQNAIFGIKIQTLTLGSRTLLLNTNGYWSEAITIVSLKNFYQFSSLERTVFNPFGVTLVRITP